MTIEGAIKPLEDKLIISAINAYMHSCGFEREGNNYVSKESASTGLGGYGHTRVVTVTAPGADGQGGGVCTSVSDYSEVPGTYTNLHRPHFENIRSRIRGALKVFHSVPKYESLDATSNSLVDLIDKLDVCEDSAAGMGEDGLLGTLQQAEHAVNGVFVGAAFDALCLKVLPELRRGILAYRATAGCLLANFRSEQAVMKRAEESVISAIESATKACDAIASDSKSDGIVVTLTIISLAVSVANLAVTAHSARKPMEVANLVGSMADLGLKTIKDKDLKDAADKFFKKPGAEVDAVISEFEKSLKKINEECRKVETEVTAVLRESISGMTRPEARHKYDLNVTPHTSGAFATTGLMIKDTEEAYKISDSVLRHLGRLMEQYAGELMKIGFSLPLVRAGGFGLGPSGSAPKLVELQGLLYQLMMDFGNEVGDYAHNLRCAIDAVIATDQDSAASLSRIDASAQQMQQDKRHPWERYDRK